MMQTLSAQARVGLDIQLTVSQRDMGILVINGRPYLLDPVAVPTLDHLRDWLADEPDYVFDAVVGMLKEVAA